MSTFRIISYLPMAVCRGYTSCSRRQIQQSHRLYSRLRHKLYHRLTVWYSFGISRTFQQNLVFDNFYIIFLCYHLCLRPDTMFDLRMVSHFGHMFRIFLVSLLFRQIHCIFIVCKSYYSSDWRHNNLGNRRSFQGSPNTSWNRTGLPLS